MNNRAGGSQGPPAFFFGQGNPVRSGVPFRSLVARPPQSLNHETTELRNGSAGAAFKAMEFIIGPSLTPTKWTMAVEKQLTDGPEVEQYLSHFGPTSLFGAFATDLYQVDDTSPGSVGRLGPVLSFVDELPGAWTIVPEPTALSLCLIGAAAFAGLAWARRKRRV